MSTPVAPLSACPHCNAYVSVDLRFCSRCGNDLSAAPIEVHTQLSVVDDPPMLDPANPFRIRTESNSPGYWNERRTPKTFFSFLSFNGRATRSEYWLTQVASFIAYFGAVIAGAILEELARSSTALEPLLILSRLFILGVFLLVVWVGIAVQVKRWHDLGESGLWVLINFVPFGGCYSLIHLGFFEGNAGRNRYGHDPLGRRGYSRRY